MKKRGLCRVTALLLAMTAAVSPVNVMAETGSGEKSYKTVKKEKKEPEGLKVFNGVKYVPKGNLETYLFMGIDDANKVHKKTEYDGSGQCDMLLLMVRDISKGTYRTLPIDRNTMTDVKSLDIEGNYLATTKNQIALSHSDGDGMEISCENTIDAVSGLLYGQEIDGYIALNMGAIKTVNHLVDGVTVTVQDDLTAADPSLRIGETVTLTDDQAEIFVRRRMDVADGTNENRISRQSQYLAALEPKLREICNRDSSFPNEVYKALEDYMVTNITMQKFTKLALLLSQEEDDEGALAIEGTAELGYMDFIEFTPDEESLQEVVATLFYEEYEE